PAGRSPAPRARDHPRPRPGKKPRARGVSPAPRHFRRACGTSPDRYRTRRRRDLARAAIENGIPLAQAAADAGFADQSHMTRQFKQAYGLTPARWANAIRAGLEVSGGVP